LQYVRTHFVRQLIAVARQPTDGFTPELQERAVRVESFRRVQHKCGTAHQSLEFNSGTTEPHHFRKHAGLIHCQISLNPVQLVLKAFGYVPFIELLCSSVKAGALAH
jgi:hypothetical protein